MTRLAGLDIGTTGSKAVVIDGSGKLIAQASRRYPLLAPRPGWSEQNPEDWWRATRECIEEVGPFDALGLTGQMHGAVFLDRNGDVIRPAPLWNDQRTANEVAEMEATLGRERIIRTTCNPPLTGFQAPKILWLRNSEPDAYARLRSVLLPKDYIRFKLSGEKFSDVSDASGTGLFNVPERRWAADLIEELGLSRSLFPEVTESDVVSAHGEFPIAGGGDQAVGAVGVGAVEEGIVSVSLGTSGVVFASQGKPDYDAQGRVHTFCHANGRWHSMGVMLSCGGALEWARDLFEFESYDEMARLASGAGETRAVFQPYLAGERTPHNDPDLRGLFRGLSLSDGRAEIARAVFQGITDGLHDGYRILTSLSGSAAGMLRVTGGGAKSDFWLQMIADTFGIPCARLSMDEGPAFGAALLAGVGIGLWPDVTAATRETVRLTDTFEPRI